MTKIVVIMASALLTFTSIDSILYGQSARSTSEKMDRLSINKVFQGGDGNDYQILENSGTKKYRTYSRENPAQNQKRIYTVLKE